MVSNDLYGRTYWEKQAWCYRYALIGAHKGIERLRRKLDKLKKEKPKQVPVRTINKIVVHWSASTYGDVEHIRKWHLERPDPFEDVGYHFVISDRGTVETGRPIEQMGAHCVGHNHDSIGVCYIGSPDMPPIYKTPIRWRLLFDLVKSIMVTYKLKPSDIYGHKDFAATECPGFDIEILRNAIKGIEPVPVAEPVKTT